MPYCEITTNVTVTDADRAELLRSTSASVAALLGKPESYVMVRIATDQAIIFGGTDDPLCHIRLASLGLPEQQTAQYSATLSEIARHHLGVEAERCYIEFVSPARHMWGFNAGTFG